MVDAAKNLKAYFDGLHQDWMTVVASCDTINCQLDKIRDARSLEHVRALADVVRSYNQKIRDIGIRRQADHNGL